MSTGYGQAPPGATMPGTTGPGTTVPADASRPTITERPSVGELLSDISRDLSTLLRQELELAKAELRQSATRAGKGAGMLAGAGVAFQLVLVFLSIAVWWGLGDAIGRAWSGLVVAALWLIISGILAAMGRSQLKSVQGIPQTTETVKKIPPAVAGKEEQI